MHKPNEISVSELEAWLRDHPDADSVARLDMIERLRQAKEKEPQTYLFTNPHTGVKRVRYKKN